LTMGAGAGLEHYHGSYVEARGKPSLEARHS
jgi:hypothetical protein